MRIKSKAQFDGETRMNALEKKTDEKKYNREKTTTEGEKIAREVCVVALP